MTIAATSLPTPAPAKNERGLVPIWLNSCFFSATALLAAHTIVVLGMLALASSDPSLSAVQLGLDWLYPLDCLGISLGLTYVGWFPDDDIISFVTVFGVVGGLQWFVLGFIGALGWHWATRVRDAHLVELIAPVVCLNLFGAFLAKSGIERLREVRFPPFQDGLFTIATLFAWPPLELVQFCATSFGAILLSVSCVAMPLLAWGIRSRLKNSVAIWIASLLLTLLPVLFGLWIWLHAQINTVGWSPR